MVGTGMILHGFSTRYATKEASPDLLRRWPGDLNFRPATAAAAALAGTSLWWGGYSNSTGGPGPLLDVKEMTCFFGMATSMQGALGIRYRTKDDNGPLR